ncbi:uncharacterized protein N7500_009116 [Penicillium coprophilum]|uniref:uncharacterized protein n=1 Tax=Penicillium coprophilum TaxID=36646 RepID=UPI002388E71F|nr:uncharacterized protein N7500_009116 [Penicillium coprophilum]KAJ5153677.1 hypothetical protein N7500_009116 [Penicillium coprophilum]
MKLLVILLALGAFAAAAPGQNLEGCSQKGQLCDGGSHLCCKGECPGYGPGFVCK